MRDTDLYARMLAIGEPWRVSLVELDAPQKRVTVTVRLDAHAEVHCPLCGAACPRYDTRRRSWRHLDTMQFQTILEADVPRVECPEHGVHVLSVPWAEPNSRFTALFEALVIDWLMVASVSAVASYLDLSWNAVDGIMQRAVKRGLEQRPLQTPHNLLIDEVSFQKRHEYVTVVSDADTRAVVYVADNRGKESLLPFFDALSPQDCAAIQTVSMDMWPPYISVVRTFVPDAHTRLCFDKFHVAKYLGTAVDSVRRAEHRLLAKSGDDRLKGTRYRWLENPHTMSLKNWRSFEHLRNSVLKTARAWAIKEHAMALWHYRHRGWAHKQWRAWLRWAMLSRLEPVKKVARTIKEHLWGIINAIVLNKTNAGAESINAQIKQIKARSCGFRNRERFRTAILFHLGGLNLYPPSATTT